MITPAEDAALLRLCPTCSCIHWPSEPCPDRIIKAEADKMLARIVAKPDGKESGE